MRRSVTPRCRSSCARNAAFVSVTLPERISLPMTMIPAVQLRMGKPAAARRTFESSSDHRSDQREREDADRRSLDRDRVLAEIAAADLDIDQARLAGGQRPFECRPNSFRPF